MGPSSASALIADLATTLDGEGRATPESAQRVLDGVRALAAGVREARARQEARA